MEQTRLFRHRLIVGAAVLASCLGAARVSAEVDDPMVYDLTGIVNTGSNAVLVCGTQDCATDISDLGDPDTVEDRVISDSTGYAIFSVIEDGPTGSGMWNPFLRFQHNEQTGKGNDTVETAYNTDNDDLQDLNDPGNGSAPNYDYENQAKDTIAGGQNNPPGDFNRAILYSELGVDEQGFVTFLLDINEPNAEDKSTLRLDELSFFISTSPLLSVYDPQLEYDNQLKEWVPVREDCDSTLDDSTIGTSDSLGCFRSADNDGAQTYKVWDMDLDEYIGSTLLDNVGSDGTAGSGDYDLSVRLDASLFEAYAEMLGGGELYVYLENTAGATDSYETGPDGEVQAGFEEWAFVSTFARRVPVPGTLLLTGLGLLILGRRVRR